MLSETLTVELDDRSYPIVIGRDTWSDPRLGEVVDGRRVLIISNETVAPLYLHKLQLALSGDSVEPLVLPDGERFKTLETMGKIYDTLLERRFDRSSVLIALGGGVIGDMAGFAAATYQRGIDFIQIPTTLLAQVDSSVGGKTAVNHSRGKNMIGAFYQPKAVFIDVGSLNTLPAREFSAGMAEVIKYGLIRDYDFFVWLEQHIEAIMARDADLLTQAISRSCATKAAVVAEDETEQDVRAILNLGHTFGHAIEAAQQYKEWLHGEAVGAGMSMAARMSTQIGMLDASLPTRIDQLLTKAGLPTAAPDNIAADRLRELMGHDKKVSRGQLRLILLKSIGEAIITADFTSEDLMRALAAKD